MDSEQKIDRQEAIELVRDASDIDVLKKSWIKDQQDREATEAELKLREHHDLINMRSKWSDSVLNLVKIIVFSGIAFSWALGLGWIKFDNNLAVPVFISDSLLKSIGLAYIIVHFLFHKDSMNH